MLELRDAIAILALVVSLINSVVLVKRPGKERQEKIRAEARDLHRQLGALTRDLRQVIDGATVAEGLPARVDELSRELSSVAKRLVDGALAGRITAVTEAMLPLRWPLTSLARAQARIWDLQERRNGAISSGPVSPQSAELHETQLESYRSQVHKGSIELAEVTGRVETAASALAAYMDYLDRS